MNPIIRGVKRLCLVAAFGVVVLACAEDQSNEATDGSTTTGPATTAVPATTAAPATAAPATTGATAPAQVAAVMPDVVCKNLQDAQNEIQRAGAFLSRSEDATGQDRNQVIDSNWLVVRQEPAAGTPIGEGDAVLFSVKYGEPNPCGE